MIVVKIIHSCRSDSSIFSFYGKFDDFSSSRVNQKEINSMKSSRRDEICYTNEL